MTNDPAHLDPKSTPALVSYALMFIWSITVGAVFILIALGVEVQEFMVGILGGIISTSSTAIGAVAAFWLAGAMTTGRKEPNKTDVIETRVETSSTEAS